MTGGGSKGAWEAGAFLALAEHQEKEAKEKYGNDFREEEHAFDWDWARLDGVSVGAINVAKLGQSKIGHIREGAEQLVELWRGLKDSDVKRGSMTWGFIRFALGWQKSVFSQAPHLGKILRRELNMDALLTSSRRVRVGTVNLRTSAYVSHEAHEVGGKEDFVKAILGSAAFPILFEPIVIDGDLHADGGLRNMAPLKNLIKDNVEHIDIIAASDPDLIEDWKPKGAMSYVSRSIDILTNEVARNDYQVTGLKNDLAELTDRYKNVTFKLWAPKRVLDEADTLDFLPEAIDTWIDEGYETVSTALKRQDEEEEVYGEPQAP